MDISPSTTRKAKEDARVEFTMDESKPVGLHADANEDNDHEGFRVNMYSFVYYTFVPGRPHHYIFVLERHHARHNHTQAIYITAHR